MTSVTEKAYTFISNLKEGEEVSTIEIRSSIKAKGDSSYARVADAVHRAVAQNVIAPDHTKVVDGHTVQYYRRLRMTLYGEIFLGPSGKTRWADIFYESAPVVRTYCDRHTVTPAGTGYRVELYHKGLKVSDQVYAAVTVKDCNGGLVETYAVRRILLYLVQMVRKGYPDHMLYVRARAEGMAPEEAERAVEDAREVME